MPVRPSVFRNPDGLKELIRAGGTEPLVQLAPGEEEFLRAIVLGRPGAKEIYCDWLDERCQPEEAIAMWHSPWPRSEALDTLMSSLWFVWRMYYLVSNPRQASNWTPSEAGWIESLRERFRRFNFETAVIPGGDEGRRMMALRDDPNVFVRECTPGAYRRLRLRGLPNRWNPLSAV